MKKLIEKAQLKNQQVFKWNIWDVIEKCRKPAVGRPQADCENCPLESACEKKAREGQGYYRIDDAITQLGRTNMASFNLEMLCSEGAKKKGWGSRFGCRLY